jgi:hypothetical protein
METLEELLRAWRDAEARGDVAALDELLAADFRGDGPLGFVLDKDGWLDQFRGGDLALEAFDWTVTEVRSTASTAVAVGIQTQTAQYLGQDCSGEFVCTLVAVRRSGHWTVTNLQLGKRSPRSLPAGCRPAHPIQPHRPAFGCKSATWSMFRATSPPSLSRIHSARSIRGEHQAMADNDNQGPNAAAGPLVVSQTNPRYFTTGSGNAVDRPVVYLTGSHIWNNFHDGLGPGGDCSETPEQNDYGAYLEFLKDHGHNFIRLWRWEQFKSQAAGGSFHLCMTPQPWPRTGPGVATDGEPKFDLDRFDPAYFDRLRDRVIAAGNEGIYVAVMFFDGFGLHLSVLPDNVEGHPFHAANNINGIGITSIVDYQVLPLEPRVLALQEAYIQKVIDTVHDLPNVLYEVANESSGDDAEVVQFPDGSSIPTPIGDSTQWQYWVIDVVKQYEQQQGYDKHPIGMTMQYPVPDQSKVNDPLFDSPADWISPGFDDELFAESPEGPVPASRWFTNPPASDGAKVVITDTDHYAAGMGDALWAWKSFLRGQNPILMDFGIVDVANPLDPSLGVPSYESFEPARYAMGDTLRFAQRMKLIEMEPRDDLSSTRYVLANPGEEYLVLQPSQPADPFTVTLEAGTYTTEWYSVTSREIADTGKVTVDGDGSVSFTVPFDEAGPAVLYLTQAGR